MLHAKLISSLEKCFADTPFASLPEVKSAYAYRNITVSLQLALFSDATGHRRSFVPVSCENAPEGSVTFRQVELIPSGMPVYPNNYDEGYLRVTPGLFPDLLAPMQMRGASPVYDGQTRCVWIDIDMSKFPESDKQQDYELIFKAQRGEELIELPYTVTLLPLDLPEVDFKVTQWFHCDCLATYYNVPVFSERHWEIVENFVKAAVRNGINTLLTPIFTPPLDTAVGEERKTVQLVGVRRTGNNRYIFDFSKLDRWIDMCDRCGVKFFEISHLFTQWGAAHAPKIMADTPEGYVRIFGWDTNATGPEYKRFLHRFLPAFLEHMKERGDDKRCIFHVSDEPGRDHLKQYLKSKAVVSEIIKDYMTIDALSKIDFYESGAVHNPVPSNNHIEPFLEAFEREGRHDLWTYYCCGQCIGVSNRLFAMPGARTRFIGIQFYKYHIAGFLQWGFNFYNNQGSYDPVNPYMDSTGNGFVPSGDTYSVYPAQDGTALDSMRIIQFREGLEDRRALELCETLIGREKTLAAVEEICGNVVFSKCVCDSVTMLKIRAAIDKLIAENI